MKKYSPEIIQLRRDVEARFGTHPASPADFESLILRIWEHNHENIALSTLERLWGYIDGADNTRLSTLNVLAHFLDYRDWQDYQDQLSQHLNGSSNPFLAEGVQTADLQPNQVLEVTWLPNRRCIFRYLGGRRFMVLESHNSKLRTGDTFYASFFLVGQPLYLDQLTRNSQSPVSYIAGNDGGLQTIRVL